jgi:transcriptional regulator with GAF, ATPase, and Fis domain
VDEGIIGIDELVTNHIRKVLSMAGGRVGGDRGAARLLKINPSTLRTKMRKLKIPFGKKAGASGCGEGKLSNE